MSPKTASIRIGDGTDQAVIEKAWLDHRVRSWQGAMDLAVKQFPKEQSAAEPFRSAPPTAPESLRVICVSVDPPDDAQVLELTAKALAKLVRQPIETAYDAMEYGRERAGGLGPVELPFKG